MTVIWIAAALGASMLLFGLLVGLVPLPPRDEPDSAAKPVTGGLKAMPSLSSLGSAALSQSLATIPTIASMGAITAGPWVSTSPRGLTGGATYGSASQAQASYQRQLLAYYSQMQAAHRPWPGLGQLAQGYGPQTPTTAPQAKDPNLAASDLMEAFIKYLKERGLSEKQARELPVDIFLAYIVLSASQAEGNDGAREKERIEAAVRAVTSPS